MRIFAFASKDGNSLLKHNYSSELLIWTASIIVFIFLSQHLNCETVFPLAMIHVGFFYAKHAIILESQVLLE